MYRLLQNRDSSVFHWGNVPYRYTFNAKETDTESDLQDYGMRIYNPRLGKFLSVDPLTRSYPELTPYQFASNTPVQAIDLDGLEMYHYTLVFDEKGKAILSYSHTEDIIERQFSWSFKNFGWNNVVNERREVIVHSGQYYEGQYNGQIVTQEINFHYSDPDPHLTEAHALTQKDINDCIESYRWMGRVAQGLANVHESYRESRPGRSNAFEADYRELRKMNMGSPFKGKTIPEIKSAMDNKVVKGDLTMMYDNPKTGAKAYFNPSSRFSYNVDPGINSRGEQVESPHVDVNYPTARRGDVKKVKHYLDGKKDYIRK
jgi:RHS repeat-associated protein